MIGRIGLIDNINEAALKRQPHLLYPWFVKFSVAEATRFERVVPLRVRQFSKLLVSATHPHFHGLYLNIVIPNGGAKI